MEAGREFQDAVPEVLAANAQRLVSDGEGADARFAGDAERYYRLHYLHRGTHSVRAGTDLLLHWQLSLVVPAIADLGLSIPGLRFSSLELELFLPRASSRRLCW